MNVTVDAEELNRAVDWATKVSKAGYVLFELCTDGYAIMRAEGDMGMRSARFQMSTSEEITEKKIFALSSPHLMKMNEALLKKKADGPVTLDFGKDDSEVEMHAKYGYLNFPVAIIVGCTYKLPTDSEDFNEIGSVDYNDFMDILKTADKATDSQKNSATQALDLTFDYKDDMIQVMGTNKFTMVVTSLSFEKYGKGDNPRFLILPDVVNFKVNSERIVIEESKESVKFVFDNGQIATTRKLANKKFNWSKVKDNALNPEKRVDDKKFIIDAGSLRLSADIAISLTDAAAKKKIVVLDITDNKMSINAGGDGNSPSDKIPVRTDVEGNTVIKFPYDELKRSLSAVSTERVAIRFAGDALPVIFDSILPDGDVDNNVFIMTRTSI